MAPSRWERLFQLRDLAVTLTSVTTPGIPAPRQIGRVYFPEDGTVYFNPDASRSGKSNRFRIRKRNFEKSLSIYQKEWLVGKCLDRAFPQPRLGVSYPDETVRTRGGPILVQSLPG
jgi:hypothetical protein